ncbi:MAG: peptidoglycan DD-metalloendopeptidase family protein [bacterium]|nr:peptidoglycan DD-metalloendopeptidase family protein [bacterium]
MGKKLLVKIIILAAFLLSANYLTVYSVTSQELQNQIDAKKQFLEQLNQEEASYNEALSEAQAAKKTLSSELTRIKAELNSINFKIKVNQTQIDKLALEIQQLKLESKDTEEEIVFKKQVLAENLRNLYEQDRNNSNLLVTVLKNENLSDSMLDVESTINFGQSIQDDLTNLMELKNLLSDQKTASENKKREMETAKNILSSRKTIAVGIQNEKSDILTKTKNQEKNYQNLLSDVAKRQDEVAAEIDRLEESLKAQIDPNLLPSGGSGILLWPVNGKITQGFGVSSFSKYLYSKGVYKTPSHNGIDLQASIGTPIVAANDGTVIALGNQDKYCYKAAYGKFIVVRHDNYLTTLYAHLSLQSVSVGDIVKRGEIIGYTGNTGYATGPHLHFTVYFGPTFKMNKSSYCGLTPIGAPVNPLNYL